MNPFGRTRRGSGADSPKSGGMASRFGVPLPGRSISSKAARAKGRYEASQARAMGRYQTSGLPPLSPRNAGVEDERPMDKKSDSCHSDGYDSVILMSSTSQESSLRVQLTSSYHEETSPLFVEIGTELVEIDEPAAPSKENAECSPDAGLPAVAEEETAEKEAETPSEGGEGGGGGLPAIAEGAAAEAGVPPEQLSDADSVETKKDLSKGFEVVRIRTGEEKIRPSTRTNKPKKYVALSAKLEKEKKERIKAEKEAEKARREADRKAEKIRKKEVEKKRAKEALKETYKKDEERFAARQQTRRKARKDEMKFNAPTPKSGNKSAKPNRPRTKSESPRSKLESPRSKQRLSIESPKKADREKTSGKASKGDVPAKKSSKDLDNTLRASGNKGVKAKVSQRQRGRTPKRALAPVIETDSSESSLAENRATSNVKKALSPRRFKSPLSRPMSPLRSKKFTVEDEHGFLPVESQHFTKESEQGTPSEKVKSPKKRSKSANRKKKSGASKSDEPKSKTEAVPRSPSGYIPLAQRIRSGSRSRSKGRLSRGFSPSRIVDDESSSSSSSDEDDEDDVRDESESSRRWRSRMGRGGRGSRRVVKRDRTFESADSRYDSVGGDSHDDFVPLSIFDNVIDSIIGGRYSMNRTVSSSSYIDGFAM